MDQINKGISNDRDVEVQLRAYKNILKQLEEVP